MTDAAQTTDAEEAWAAFDRLLVSYRVYRLVTKRLMRSQAWLYFSIGMFVGFAASQIGGWLHS